MVAFPVAKAANGLGVSSAASAMKRGGALGCRPRPCYTRVKAVTTTLGQRAVAGSVSRQRVRGSPEDVDGDGGRVVPVMRGGVVARAPGALPGLGA